VVTSGGLSPRNFYYTYLLAMDYDLVDGISGMRCGISYPAEVRIFGWYSCALNEVSTDSVLVWPASGSGAEWNWNAGSTDPLLGCQRSGAGVVAGYFYMGAYEPGGTLRVFPDPKVGRAAVVSCKAVEDKICGPGDIANPCTGVTHLGTATFNASATGGYNPCGYVTRPRPADARAFPPCDYCGQVPTERITWGTVKATYRSPLPEEAAHR
jgi:hypothetical protein